MAAEPEELNLVQPEDLVVKVHPVVLFSICDSFMRRNEGQERVIGTLLGRVSRGSKVVEVKNCFAVPFQEASDQVQLDISYQRTMAELHKTVTASEVYYAISRTLLVVSLAYSPCRCSEKADNEEKESL